MKSVRIFISYAREDHDTVLSIFHRLKKVGFDPWLDTQDILPGEQWEETILKGMKASDFILICLSKQSSTKMGFLQKEMKYALRLAQEKLPDQIYIIPLKLEECHIPEYLSPIQTVSYHEPDGWTKLLLAIEAEIQKHVNLNKFNVFIVAPHIAGEKLSQYTLQWANELMERLKNIQHINLIPVFKDNAVRHTIEILLKQHIYHSGIFIFIDNATKTELMGSDNKSLIDENNISLLKNKFIYAVAPYSSSTLGRTALNAGVSCYMGFNDSLRIPDNAWKIFGAILLKGLISIIEENRSAISVKERFELETYKLQDLLIKKLGLRHKVDLAILINSLQHNMKSVEFLGTEDWKIGYHK